MVMDQIKAVKTFFLLTAVVYEALAKAERDKRTNARASHHEPKRGPFRPPPVPPPACSGS